MKFGLIPEFIGRLPVVGAVSHLYKDALIRILVEPKNALTRQYKRTFELDHVELELTTDALEAVAEQALLRGTGARGTSSHPRRGAARGDVRLARPQRHLQVRGRPGRRPRSGAPDPGAATARRPSRPAAAAPRRRSSPPMGRRQMAGRSGPLCRPDPDRMTASVTFDDLAQALEWLDSHTNYESTAFARRALPSLDRIRELCHLLGDPQHAYPSVHITGTNGKGSTAAMATALLAAQGLTVGTYTSPNLTRVNERLARNGEPIDDQAFCDVLEALSRLEPMMAERPDPLRAAHGRRTGLVRRRGGRRRRHRGRARGAVGLHQRGGRRGVRGHQHQLRPHRDPRPDPRGHRPGQVGHLQGGQPGGHRRGRPGARGPSGRRRRGGRRHRDLAP